MLKSYSYIESKHQKLHKAVISFFERIEEETGDFNNNFFDTEFLKVAKRHKKIIYGRLKSIYEVTKTWEQDQRTELCEQIRQSNLIDDICSNTASPQKLDKDVTGVQKTLREFFLALYNQVLDGRIIREEWGISLREHFDAFRANNGNIITCPICGINPIKTKCDDQRDQYDHYLPKSLYPYSAINFKNLVPTCTDCNSTQIKGDKDIIEIANNGALFFPFEENHSDIDIICELTLNASVLEDTEWDITYSSDQECDNQIRAWKEIYSIESRHKSFIQGRLDSWLKSYIKYSQTPEVVALSANIKRITFLASLKVAIDESPLKYAALSAFLKDGLLQQAMDEAKKYS